jgi:sugar phosphate isomerase/epimerase
MRRLLGVRFRRIAAVLDRHGLKFGLEFLGPAHFRDDPGFTFVYRMEDMLAFAEEIGSNVGVLVDSFHWHCLGGTHEALAAIPRDRLVYAHINDARDVPREAQRDDDRLLPGEGIIDLRGFLGGLRAAGYDGPVGIEVDGPYLAQVAPDEAAERARRAWDVVATPHSW